MSDFQTEQKKRMKMRARKLRPRKQIFLLASILVLIYLTVIFGGRIITNYQMDDRIRTAQAENQRKHDRIQQLEQQKIDLNDPEHIKEIARKNLYYMDKDEVHIKITPNPSDDTEK